MQCVGDLSRAGAGMQQTRGDGEGASPLCRFYAFAHICASIGRSAGCLRFPTQRRLPSRLGRPDLSRE
jgi:hypothetical protein